MMIVLYFLPVIPLGLRMLLFCLFWRQKMCAVLQEEAQERDVQRTFTLVFAGFSFTAVAGLVVLDNDHQLPAWYLLLSFITYISTINIHSYKSKRWQNQLATALFDTGTFSLMLALVSLIHIAKFDCAFTWISTTITLGAWLSDYLIRLIIDYKYLKECKA